MIFAYHWLDHDLFVFSYYVWLEDVRAVIPTKILPKGLDDIDDSLTYMHSIHNTSLNSLIGSLHMYSITTSRLCVPLCHLLPLPLPLVRLILEVDVELLKNKFVSMNIVQMIKLNLYVFIVDKKKKKKNLKRRKKRKKKEKLHKASMIHELNKAELSMSPLSCI